MESMHLFQVLSIVSLVIFSRLISYVYFVFVLYLVSWE